MGTDGARESCVRVRLRYSIYGHELLASAFAAYDGNRALWHVERTGEQGNERPIRCTIDGCRREVRTQSTLGVP